jgi:uncharacterized DUF497 family protein
MAFEYNSEKNKLNKKNHGIDFEESKIIFDDPNLVSFESVQFRDGEYRDIHLGMSVKGILYVVTTERGKSIRIISARKATKNEQAQYHL